MKGEKNMKRILAILIISVFASVFYGCGNNTNLPEKDKEATVQDSNKKQENTKDSTETDNRNKDIAKEKNINLGETITIGDVMEFTPEELVWQDEIKPSNTKNVYSYLKDEPNNKFLILKGHLKNIAGETLQTEYTSKVKAVINGKYNYEGSFQCEGKEGNDFYGTPAPLETTKFIIFTSIPNSAIDSFKDGKLKIKITSDSNKILNYFDENTPCETLTLDINK